MKRYRIPLFLVAVAVGIAVAGAVWSLRDLRSTGENAFSRGEQFFQLGDLDNAEKEFRRAIEMDPESESARAAAGYLETIAASQVEITR